MANKYKAQLVTTTAAITGSINKILSCGQSGSITNTFDDVQFGVFTSNIETDTVSTVDNFTLANGTYLHGPITGFSLNAAGSVLVYYND